MSDDCGKVISELQTYLDGEVGPDFAQAVAAHLHECPPCEDRAEFERRVRAIIAAKCTDCAPVDLRERIMLELFSS